MPLPVTPLFHATPVMQMPDLKVPPLFDLPYVVPHYPTTQDDHRADENKVSETEVKTKREKRPVVTK